MFLSSILVIILTCPYQYLYTFILHQMGQVFKELTRCEQMNSLQYELEHLRIRN